MQEKVLMEGIANPITKRGLVKNGHGVLTSRRFIYNKHSLGKILLIGAYANLTKGQYEYDIPLEDIQSIETGRYMLGHALTITKTDGEVLKYGIGKQKEWQSAIDRALNPEPEEEQPPLPEPEPQTTTAAKNFCSNCGAKLEGAAKFCANCGAKA